MDAVEAEYFDWLCSQVTTLDSSRSSVEYWRLLNVLYSYPFTWVLEMDDNRAADGLDLHGEFTYQTGRTIGNFEPTCSVLEMLIALARKAEFQTGISTRDWFWIMITNLGMDGFTDDTNVSELEIEEILETFIWRTYEPNGVGGLFPMQSPKEDQRKVEIWYQFHQYLDDQHI